MNGVLPTLTWGTWDELDWRCHGNDNAAASTSTLPLASTTSTSNSNKSQRKLLKKGLRAPADSQLWFDEVLALVESSAFGHMRCRYRCNPLRCVHEENNSNTSSTASRAQSSLSLPSMIPWDDLPDGIHPRDGKLPPLRARNKRHQVENLAVFLQRMLQCVHASAIVMLSRAFALVSH